MSAPSAGRSRARLEFAAAVGLDLIAAATALLLCTRAWQSVLLARPRPLGDDVLHVSGRTVDRGADRVRAGGARRSGRGAGQRGLARRLVGLVLVGAGVRRGGLGRRCDDAAVGPADPDAGRGPTRRGPRRAEYLAGERARRLGGGLRRRRVLIALVGVLVCLRGGRWAAMSARYTAPVAGAGHRPSDSESGSESVAASGDDQQQARIQSSMWSALERGEDPTAPGGAGLE